MLQLDGFINTRIIVNCAHTRNWSSMQTTRSVYDGGQESIPHLIECKVCFGDVDMRCISSLLGFNKSRAYS